MKMLNLFIVSDSIGETGELVARAAVSQFRPGLQHTKLKRFTHIDSMDHIKEITALAKEQNASILYTLVQQEMREAIVKYCKEYELECVDLIGPVINLLEKKLEEKSFEEPGLVRKLDEDYFKKIEAVEFAVKYDDGRDPKGISRGHRVQQAGCRGKGFGRPVFPRYVRLGRNRKMPPKACPGHGVSGYAEPGRGEMHLCGRYRGGCAYGKKCRRSLPQCHLGLPGRGGTGEGRG